ncbi:hypothetical protein Tco_0895649 [Tanacetum coccineum]|uniref:Uncharacterized protein n=1 Tax=Tanacetum coccineum TaxID=301880 RepID=A0ABQ5CI07_9ASTR
MLERGNYIPWESRFRRFLDNKLEEGERMWNSIQNGPYVRPMIPDPDGAVNIIGTVKQILVPLSKMTKGNKKQYIVDVKCYSNTKFLNCLQPEWSKYVTMVRHNQTGETGSYDMLYDSLVQFKPHVLASKAKKTAKNHDPLALIAHSNASSSQSHANSSYSLQPYYVTHPSSVVDYEDEYQRELQGDSQEDKLTTAMMLLARAITQKQLCSWLSEPRVRDAKYFREQMLLAMKDEAGSNLNNEENDFMLDTSYDEETIEELTAAVMLMARIQPTDGNAETVPSYDAKVVSEVNASSKVHEQMFHEKRKTIIQTFDDDQIDSNIIFDDPYVENNDGTFDNDSNDHEEYHKIQMLAYDVQREAKNQKRLNNELKKQKMLLQKEFETYICDLEEKQSSHDRIVYKMGQSIQTIHMLRKTPNTVYDPFLKAGLGYKNPESHKKAITAQPNMYDGEKLYSTKLVIDSPDLEETLKDGKENVFLLSHEKCVARYALSRNSSVTRALFTTPIAAKSKNLRATSVVAKSRLSFAKTPKATNKVFSASSLSHDSSQSKTLSNYMKNKIATSRKWQRWFEYQQSFNWSPKSKTAQSLPSETKSRIRVRSTSNTPVTTQKWVAKLSTLPSAFVSCDAGDSARPLDC